MCSISLPCFTLYFIALVSEAHCLRYAIGFSLLRQEQGNHLYVFKFRLSIILTQLAQVDTTILFYYLILLHNFILTPIASFCKFQQEVPSYSPQFASQNFHISHSVF